MAKPVTRRSFIKSSAAAAAGVWSAGAGLSFLPAVSWGRVLGSNDRINIGVIGTGGQGTYHVDALTKMSDAENVKCIQVCDVYRRRLNNAIKIIGGNDSSGTMEYERLIANKDLNAILIATPDHWHTKMAIEAMDAGKDVYVEKPLSLTAEQAIECRNAAKRTKRVLQVGPQGTSEDRWWKARDAIKSGRIGKVVWSQAAYCRNSRGGQFNWSIDPKAGPQGQGDDFIDWDRWLGHKFGLAPKIDYNADHFFRFRKYWAYNGGVATDLMYHRLAPLLIAITGPDGEYPLRVTAAGGQYIEKDGRDIGDTLILMIDYPSEHTIVLASVMVNDVGLEDMIRGQYATMRPAGSGWKFSEQGTWAPEFRKANADKVQEKTVKNKEGKDTPDPAHGKAEFELAAENKRGHTENFLDAIRGTAKPNCNIDLGCSTMVAIKMGVEAYRQKKVMSWDAKAEKVLS